MLELSLFSGVGGGIWATKYMLGWRCVGYVERNKFCQSVLRARIDDGSFDRAPIYGEIQSFISDGYAEAYSGMVDILTGSPPCQPFSDAGKRLGAADARNCWPYAWEAVRVIRPRFAFFENVPGLVSSGYFPTILGNLAQVGYDVRWGVFSASSLGAPHYRERLFMVAYANDKGLRKAEPQASAEGADRANAPQRSQDSERVQSSVPLPIWDGPDARVWGVANGLADRRNRFAAIGNGLCAPVVARAWRVLTGGLI